MASDDSRDLGGLLDRNVLWAQRKRDEDPTFFVRLSGLQTPKYLWIGCSDSRVTANDVLDLDPGEVFVHRNIANVAHTSDMNLLAVLEYAIDVLKVQHIIVCGHYGCGGIARALGDDRSALVDYWLQPIVMFYRKHRAVFDALPDAKARHDLMAEINIEMQVRRVAAAPIVAAHHLTKGPITKRDGAFIGTVVGLCGGWIVADMPHLGPWFIVTSAVVCATAGFRAPLVFEKARRKTA